MQALLDHARAERSSAIVLVKDGKIVVERYRDGDRGEPIMAMSASKSIVSLAVGMLVADGKLTLETRLSSLFPEWNDLGEKGSITVRQLLTHTSGLDPDRADFAHETIVDHFRAAKLVFPPGTRFQYNNDAVDFLAVVVQKAAGVPLDVFLEKRLFAKLDVVDASWMKDIAGTPRGAGELMIRPVDLAKVGQMMLDGGKWHGETIVSHDWVVRSVDVGDPLEEDCGLLWWREGTFAHTLNDSILDQWRALGLAETDVHGARSLVGSRFATRSDFRRALEKAVGAPALKDIDTALLESNHVPLTARVATGTARGYSARGWLGQFLVVVPEASLVAVRMREQEDDDDGDGPEKDAWPGFADDVLALADRAQPGQPAATRTP